MCLMWSYIRPVCIRPFSKLRYFANWQLADCNRHINCNHQSPKTGISTGFRNFITRNICDIPKFKTIISIYLFLIVCQYNNFVPCTKNVYLKNPHEKFCVWALMIAINASAAICQFPIRQFSELGKTSNV